MEEQHIPGATNVSDKTIGEFVAEDYRTADVFEKYGIDFCCGGNVSLSEACSLKGIDSGAILLEIDAAKSEPVERGRDYAAWALPFLADYIINTHHGYLNENMEQIAGYARKIAEVHGANHPEVIEIAAIFDRIASDMAAHLREEEEVLFPAIRRIDAARRPARRRSERMSNQSESASPSWVQSTRRSAMRFTGSATSPRSTPYRTMSATPSSSPTGSSGNSRTISTSTSTLKTTFFFRRRHDSRRNSQRQASGCCSPEEVLGHLMGMVPPLAGTARRRRSVTPPAAGAPAPQHRSEACPPRGVRITRHSVLPRTLEARWKPGPPQPASDVASFRQPGHRINYGWDRRWG